MVKSFQKAGSIALKKLARSTKISQANDCLSKLVPKTMRASLYKTRPAGEDEEAFGDEDSRSVAYTDELPPEVVA